MRSHRTNLRRWIVLPLVAVAFLLGWYGAQAAADRTPGPSTQASSSTPGAPTDLAEAAVAVVEAVDDPAPSPARHQLDRRYPTRDGMTIGYDMRWPANGAGQPVVVLLHGGGWWAGDKQDASVVAVAMTLQRAGFVVVSANYRLACGTATAPRAIENYRYALDSPLCGATIPTQVADVVDLVEHLQSSARSLQVDPRRIALMGMSAGGHLALLAAAQPDHAFPVRAVVNWSGAPSVEFIERQSIVAAGKFDRSIRASFTNAIGCPRTTCPARWVRASPIDAIARHRPRLAVMSVAGERETQVPLAELDAFHQRLDALRMDNALLAGAGLCHGAGCAPLLLSEGTTTGLDASIDFLQRTLRAPAPAG